MPHLLEKFAELRRSRPAAPKHRRRSWREPHPHEAGWHWTFVVLAIVMSLVAYFWYTSSHILREPIRVKYGPADPEFSAALGPLLGAEFVGGNSVETLLNGDEFFPVMLDDIRHAKKTITLETYIWSPGMVSDQFIAALTERARHGVKVHVMLDGMGTLKFTHDDRERLTSAGVQVLTYGRQHWYEIKPNINQRTHRKLLIIDGRIGFTGGMCIDDKWQGHAESPKVWRETEVRVTGPVVREMQAVFEANWLQTTSGLVLGAGYFPELERTGTTIAECFESGPGEHAESARLSYLMAIAAARKTIDITHAYFVPDDLAIETLLEARKRGVRIRVIVPAINDSRFGRAASRSRWGRLLAAGVEFYRYTPAMLHAKTMIVDDLFVSVGSVNFDNRSFSINDEDALNVLDGSVARDFQRAFADDLKHCTPLTLREFENRPFYIKLADWFCGLFRSQL